MRASEEQKVADKRSPVNRFNHFMLINIPPTCWIYYFSCLHMIVNTQQD